MMITNRTILSLVLLTSALPAISQQTERPPATPLIAHDPYFSVWSATDKLTDSPTVHWTGHPEPLTSLVRVDGKTFRIMGRDPRNVPAMEQTASHLSFTHTRYSFRGAGVQIDLTFFTPAFLDDLDVLSRPVTYLTWTAHAIDGGSHTVSIFIDAQTDIATSWSRSASHLLSSSDRIRNRALCWHKAASNSEPFRRRPPHRLGILPHRPAQRRTWHSLHRRKC